MELFCYLYFLSYNSDNFTEASTGNFLTGLSPTNQSGANLTNTSAVINQVVDGNGNDVTGQFSITRTGAGPYLYNFGKVGTNFVYNHDVNPRNYTIKTVITNLTPNPDVVSAVANVLNRIAATFLDILNDIRDALA